MSFVRLFWRAASRDKPAPFAARFTRSRQYVPAYPVEWAGRATRQAFASHPGRGRGPAPDRVGFLQREMNRRSHGGSRHVRAEDEPDEQSTGALVAELRYS